MKYTLSLPKKVSKGGSRGISKSRNRRKSNSKCVSGRRVK